MICSNCNKEIRDGAMFCPHCGQRQASGRASYEAPKSSPERHDTAYRSAPAPEWPSPAPEWPSPAPKRTGSYSRPSAPQINVGALIVVIACVVIWFAAPLIDFFVECTAMEYVTEPQTENLLWWSATLLSLGILVSGICVLCGNNGAKGAAGTALVLMIVFFVLWATDHGADDLGEIVEAFTDVWGWGWTTMSLGLLSIAAFGGTKK